MQLTVYQQRVVRRLRNTRRIYLNTCITFWKFACKVNFHYSTYIHVHNNNAFRDILLNRMGLQICHNLIGGSLRVTLVVDWLFYPEIFCRWRGPMKPIYHWVKVDGVVILLGGGGDTWSLFCIIKLFWTKRWWGAKNLNSHFLVPHLCSYSRLVRALARTERANKVILHFLFSFIAQMICTGSIYHHALQQQRWQRRVPV